MRRHGVALVALMVGGVASAAETGHVRGMVVDDTGAPVVGAVITVSGRGIGGEIPATTDASGRFYLLSVPVGTHDARFVKTGLSAVRLELTVRLDETAVVPITMSIGQDEVMFDAPLPIIDPTRSWVSTDLTRETLDKLPAQDSLSSRGYLDILKILPGVHGRIDYGSSKGNPSVRGEGAYGNNYLVDGISTRNPENKGFGSTLPYDAIESMQVYTDGAPAEFGQFTGMVVNVVTRDGGDEHFGSAGYTVASSASSGTYLIADLDTHAEVETAKRDALDQSLVLMAGGPIQPERLWYMTTVDMGLGSVVGEGGDPDVPKTMQRARQFAKLTWFLRPDLTLRYHFTGHQAGSENTSDPNIYEPSAQTGVTVGQQAHEVSAEWKMPSGMVADGKALFQTTRYLSYPMSDDLLPPQIKDLDTGIYTGNTLARIREGTSRIGVTGSLTRLAEWMGPHVLKGGVELFLVSDTEYRDYTGQGAADFIDADSGAKFEASAAEGYPCERKDYTDCYGYWEWMYGGQEFAHRGRLFAAYLQDSWTIQRWTANIGFRLDHEKLIQSQDQVVLSHWMPAPRLGLVWDLAGDSRTVATAHYGRYYDISGNSLAGWADQPGPNSFSVYRRDSDTGEFAHLVTQDTTDNPYTFCTEQSLALLSGIDQQMARDACGGDLKPYHSDKLVLGLQHELVPGLVGGFRGITSATRNLPDDLQIDESITVITNVDNKVRNYRALELFVDRSFRTNWQVFGSYTLSESLGTMPGHFEAPPGSRVGSNGNSVGAFGDDIDDLQTRADLIESGDGSILESLAGYGTSTDDAGMYGYLPYHSLHMVKLSGSYQAPFGTQIGVLYEFDSGHAWQMWSGYTYPQGRGSRTMPSVHFLDVSVSQTVALPRDIDVVAVLDVFNPFDWDAPVLFYASDDENFGLTLGRQAPRAVRLTVKGVY